MNKIFNGITNLFSKLSDQSRKLGKLDWIIIFVFVLFYSIMSFKDLGTTSMPQTYFGANNKNVEASVRLTGDKTNVSFIRHFTGPEIGEYEVLVSEDGSTYESVGIMKQESVFSWADFKVDKTFKYIKFVSEQAGSYLGEVQLYDTYGKKLDLKAENDQSAYLVDELGTVPSVISYKNSTYFDEIYFARTAYEYANGMITYEWVHPPLGKLIQSIPIIFMGMNTFSFRLMGNIAGILMIVVMYVFGKTIFKDRKYAIMAASLMTFDCFHFAHTRMGTIDSFLVLFMMLSALFMYKYLVMRNRDSVRKKILYLFLSGLFVGCAIATKWTGMFTGLALAIVFFGHLFYRNRKSVVNKMDKKDIKKIILSCILFFVFIPIVIYLLSYFLFPNTFPYTVNSFTELFNQTKEMFKYHAQLNDTHPFTSNWYTWPVMYKPVWYYVSYLSGDLKSTIVGIGNPAIWWVGIISTLFILVSIFGKKMRKQSNLFILTFILCSFLPYLFIGRIMFMYHYFPVLPFLMLGIVAMFKKINESLKTNSLMIFYIGVVIIFFIYFFPIISGGVNSSEYIDSLKWLSSWIF